jgi:general secretion pathway protein A
MKKQITFMLVAVLLLFTQAGAEEELDSIALALTDYLIAGRAVVAVNQPRINTPFRMNKGFTPQAYEEQVIQEFIKRSGIDITNLAPSDDFNKALITIHESAKEVIAEAQRQINKRWEGFKRFNPAVFGRNVGRKLYARSGIVVKQTSLKFRKDHNKPDDFELFVLKKFEISGKGSTYVEETKIDDAKVLRYMTPLYIEKACLRCHGGPAGEIDITGMKKEGYKLGELRGAISVIVPEKIIFKNNNSAVKDSVLQRY